MASSHSKEIDYYGIDTLYNSLIQSCIESYVQNIINQEELKISTNDMLTVFSKCRRKIAYIMSTISDKLNYNYFCKKEDLKDFGVERNNIIITPLTGKYNKSFIELKGKQSSFISKDYNIKFAEDRINLYSESAYRKQIKLNNISLSYIHYEYNEEEFNKNPQLSRCIYHSALDSKKELLKNYEDVCEKDIKNESEFYTYLLELIWILSQLTIFKRGSASITEMVVSAVSSLRIYILSKENINYVVKKGVDLLAIYNDLQEFKNKCKNITIISVDYRLNKRICMSLEDLDNLHTKILTMSKEEIRNSISEFNINKDYSCFNSISTTEFDSNVKDITNSLSDIL